MKTPKGTVHYRKHQGEADVEFFARVVNDQFNEIVQRMERRDNATERATERLARIDDRLDRIETLLVTAHDRRLKHLEDELDRIKGKLNVV